MTDAPGHLDLDALADVLAGERDDRHLRSCVSCADRLADLAAADASVSAALSALPAPPLPDGLSARLTRAVQDERHRELASVRSRRRQAPGWLPAVAACAVLVMAGAAGWSLLDLSGGASMDAASSDAGGGSGGSEESGAAPEAAAGLALPRTGTDWADETTRQAALARLLLARDVSDTALPSATALTSGDGSGPLRDPAEVAACLAGLPGGDDDVLAVDHGQYAGAPAVAVVQAGDPGFVEVTVVASPCSATDPALLDELVLPRP